MKIKAIVIAMSVLSFNASAGLECDLLKLSAESKTSGLKSPTLFVTPDRYDPSNLVAGLKYSLSDHMVGNLVEDAASIDCEMIKDTSVITDVLSHYNDIGKRTAIGDALVYLNSSIDSAERDVTTTEGNIKSGVATLNDLLVVKQALRTLRMKKLTLKEALSSLSIDGNTGITQALSQHKDNFISKTKVSHKMNKHSSWDVAPIVSSVYDTDTNTSDTVLGVELKFKFSYFKQNRLLKSSAAVIQNDFESSELMQTVYDVINKVRESHRQNSIQMEYIDLEIDDINSMLSLLGDIDTVKSIAIKQRIKLQKVVLESDRVYLSSLNKELAIWIADNSRIM